MILTYIKLMRVKHWIKNILIFLPLFFSSNILNLSLSLKSFLGFLSFSLAASAVYIINDIKDAGKDRLHSVKCNRPIASGQIPVLHAVILFVSLILLSAFLNFIADGQYLLTSLFLFTYFVINIGYSFGLKNKPIIDIAILAVGFILRVLYGSALISVQTSRWLYLTIIAVSFFMGLGKRRNEIIRQADGTREVLKHYNFEFLDKFMYTCLTLIIVFYSLWSVDPQTSERFSNNHFVLTVPLVIIICMKYSLDIERNSDGDPVDVLFGDKLLIILVILYILSACIIAYWAPLTSMISG